MVAKLKIELNLEVAKCVSSLTFCFLILNIVYHPVRKIALSQVRMLCIPGLQLPTWWQPDPWQFTD